MQISQHVPVSVIIPCLNCEDTICRALYSVSQQTWLPREVILVDDGSTDETLSRLQNLRESLGLSWIKVLEQDENRGPGAARNIGWDSAKQPYVAFLDSDDSWHPCKIEIQLKYMQDHPDVAISGHGSRWLREGEPPSPLSNHYAIKPVNKGMMLVSNRWTTPTVMLKRDLDVRFDSTKRHSEDYLLWLRIIFGGYTAMHIDLDLAYLHKASYGSRGLSSQLWLMERGELDTYKRLCNDKLISWPTFMALCAFSMAKYVRRVTISKLRMIRR